MQVFQARVAEVAGSADVGGPAVRRKRPGACLVGRWPLTVACVAVLTAVGLALRLAIAGQSLFADELSTYWIVSTNGLGGVVSTVHTDAEITPPLSFVLAWLTTRLELTPELLRAPSLIAGSAAIPLIYLVGLRTVGRGAALVATALCALSPFMTFYSTEARGYALAITLVLGSTLALLVALDDGRVRLWVAYAACTCAAVYSHYTVVFALGAQLIWLLWAHPEARRAALLANVAAIVVFLPWLPGVINDFESPTTDIVDALDVFTLPSVLTSLEHWSFGYPYVFPSTSLSALPGVAALVLLGLGVATATVGVAGRWARARFAWRCTRRDRRLLIAALAIGAPVGIVLFSAVSTNLIAVRHLAASWPAFALLLATLLLAAGPRLRPVAVALVVASFAIGAERMLDAGFARPNYEAAAGFIERHASPGDVVIDGTNLSPAPITALDVALDGRRPMFYLGRLKVQYDPFRILAGPPPAAQVARAAVAAADGARIFIVSSETVATTSARGGNPLTDEAISALPPGYRRVETRYYPGILRLATLVYARRASPQG